MSVERGGVSVGWRLKEGGEHVIINSLGENDKKRDKKGGDKQ